MPANPQHESVFQAVWARYQGASSEAERASFIQSLEGLLDPEQFAYVKVRLWERIAELEQATRELDAVVRQQASLLEEATKPPLLRGMVLAEPQNDLVLVAVGTRRFEVEVSDRFDGGLTPGREVVLTGEGTAIVDIREFSTGGEVGTLDTVLPDQRLVVGDHASKIVLNPIAELRGLELEPGQAIRYDRTHGLAFEAMPQDETQQKSVYSLEEEIDHRALEIIAGLDAEMRELLSLINLSLRSDLVGAYDMRQDKGCILHGPPGCGKTLLVRAALAKLKDDGGLEPLLLLVPPSGLSSMWVGEGPRKTRELFDGARRAAETGKLVVIVMDELEWLSARTGRRAMDGGARATDNLVQAVCSEIDGMRQLQNVFIIGTTNRYDVLDTAFTRAGRLETQIRIPRPNAVAARAIFVSHLRKTPIRLNGKVEIGSQVAADLLEDIIPTLYSPESCEAQVVNVVHRDGRNVMHRAPEFMSGAQIEHWCLHAKRQSCIRDTEAGESKPTGLTRDDLRDSIDQSLDRLAETTSAANLPDHLGHYNDPEARIDIVSVTSARPPVRIHKYVGPEGVPV